MKQPSSDPKTIKETLTQSPDERKQALKAKLKKALKQIGPLDIPEEYLDPEYHYRYPKFSSTDYSAVIRCQKLGYVFVKPDEMPGLQTDLSTRHAGFTVDNDNGRIAFAGHGDWKHVIMKLPLEEFQLIQEIEDDERKERKTMSEEMIEKNNITGTSFFK